MSWLRRTLNVIATFVLAYVAVCAVARMPVEPPAILNSVTRLCRGIGIVVPEDIEMVELSLLFCIALVFSGVIVWAINRALRRGSSRN